MYTVLQTYEGLISSFLCQTLATSLAIVGTLVLSFGSVLLMQKPSRTPIAFHDPSYFTTLWWSGIGLNMLGGLIQMVSCFFLSSYISGHVNTFTLMTTLLLSRILFHTITSLLETMYILGTCLGSIICIVISFFPHDQSYIVSDIESWTSQAYQFYVFLCAGMLIVVFLLWQTIRFRLQTFHKPKAFHDMSLECFMKSFQLNCTEKHRQITRDTINDRLLYSNTTFYHKRNILLLTYTALLESIAAGTLAAQIDLQLRECYMLVQILAKSEFIGLTPNLIRCVAFIFIEGLLQVYFFNSALKNSSASLVVPVHYVFCIILGSLGGCIKFRDFWSYSEQQLHFLMLGFFLIIICNTGLTRLELQRLFQSKPITNNDIKRNTTFLSFTIRPGRNFSN